MHVPRDRVYIPLSTTARTVVDANDAVGRREGWVRARPGPHGLCDGLKSVRPHGDLKARAPRRLRLTIKYQRRTRLGATVHLKPGGSRPMDDQTRLLFGKLVADPEWVPKRPRSSSGPAALRTSGVAADLR